MKKLRILASLTALAIPFSLTACAGSDHTVSATDSTPSADNTVRNATISKQGTATITATPEPVKSTDSSQNSPDQVSSFDLKVGDCILKPDSDSVTDLTRVSCEQAHYGEVYLNHKITGYDTYPGNDVVSAAAQKNCLEAFADYVGSSYDSSAYDIIWLSPNQDSWDSPILRDRTITCLVIPYTGTSLTGSVKDSGK